ncbi:hypothetical protein AURDEDRAFT_162472 [Auricularia subglabra TFB-10046 SS5]|nr:hypothetical protein AURDEDRAFT_162472 [Auricularia subglabra TFB-10046 SS5]
MAAPSAPPNRSPFKSVPRSLRHNQLAPPKYTMEKACNVPVTVATYVADTKKSAVTLVDWDKITSNEKVKGALDAVADMGYSDTGPFYGAATYLLNCISHAYLEATASTRDPETPPMAIVFSSSSSDYVPGDFLNAAIKPDLLAFVDDPDTLARALQKVNFAELKHCSFLGGVGEWKKRSGIPGQFLWYETTSLRYRPDLSIVHGLLIDNGRLRLASLNACGSWASGSETIGKVDIRVDDKVVGHTIPSTDTWIAFVVLLYKAHAERDTRFSLTHSENKSAQWEVALPGFKPTVRPFHVTLPPGRMTWASFVLDLPESDVSPPTRTLAKGFLKTSWQDSSAVVNETFLLGYAHTDTWLPGLVRHWTSAIDERRTITLPDGSSEHTTRWKELVYLASVGQPLSQCKSALHLLKVIYDAAETHLHLLTEGILHGDMSWFNILCNPWHDNATLSVQPVAEGIPCIDFILTGDAKKSQPCALVLDLDHAALVQVIYMKGYNGRREKTGTPMFVSVELSSKTAVSSGSTRRLASIEDRLAELDNRRDLYARAFPDGDNDFMNNFRYVVEEEKKRIAADDKAYTDPKSLHRPHHDVESLYWVLLWAFARACPSGHSPHGTLNDPLTLFADVMLEHRLGEETLRCPLIFGEGVSEEVFHPLLREHFYPALEALAIYLSVPWQLYAPDVHPCHAHVALRRLLLPLIDDIVKKKIPDVSFNTAQPRTILSRRAGQDRKIATGPGTPTLMKSIDRIISSNSRCRTPPATPPPQLSPLPSVERAPMPSFGPATDLNRLLANRPRGRRGDVKDILPDYFFERGTVKRAVDDHEKEPAAKRAKTVPEPDGERHPRDLNALIQMFWADRTLWFGSGFHNEADANAALAAALRKSAAA